MGQAEFMRNLIIETPSVPGNFAKVAMAIGTLEGDIGDIQTIKIGTLSTIRDVSIQCRSEAHLLEIVEKINGIGNGIVVHAISDDVLQAHERQRARRAHDRHVAFATECVAPLRHGDVQALVEDARERMRRIESEWRQHWQTSLWK